MAAAAASWAPTTCIVCTDPFPASVSIASVAFLVDVRSAHHDWKSGCITLVTSVRSALNIDNKLKRGSLHNVKILEFSYHLAVHRFQHLTNHPKLTPKPIHPTYTSNNNFHLPKAQYMFTLISPLPTFLHSHSHHLLTHQKTSIYHYTTIICPLHNNRQHLLFHFHHIHTNISNLITQSNRLPINANLNPYSDLLHWKFLSILVMTH
ncbi:hypothetical protein D1007_21095 [Hordeum vulgare]|nr:hypothetical protein D1007_21095 [Hordeum vulgare]